MSKNKLQKFKEIEAFERVIQPGFEEVYRKDYPLKGAWAERIFHNSNPITLELGCGKGEYTLYLARKFPERNFIGIDIKGARIWRGAKTAIEDGLSNVAFLRTRIELIGSFFAKDEVEEIWITFPDPQLKRKRAKKRLTSARFLNHYRDFLIDRGMIHLKTDSEVLHDYTCRLVQYNGLEVIKKTKDLYKSDFNDDILSIKTTYEKLFLEEGYTINYLSFLLPSGTEIRHLKEDEQE